MYIYIYVYIYTYIMYIACAKRNHVPASTNPKSYMLNTRNKDTNAVFCTYLACFVKTFSLNMYLSMAYTGLTRRNTMFVFLWPRDRNM